MTNVYRGDTALCSISRGALKLFIAEKQKQIEEG